MNWYLIHTKPQQEQVALLNLTQQGYECYLPRLSVEKVRRGKLVVAREPLFPRYLFIRLDTGESAKSWSPIRSTRGVGRLVFFGREPAQVSDELVSAIRTRTEAMPPKTCFAAGDRVQVTEGAFAGVDAICETVDGEGRVMILLNLLNRPVKMWTHVAVLRKAG